MPSRRRVLSTCGVALASIAGCVSELPATEETEVSNCSASPPPSPDDAAADPKPYPERPAELTVASLDVFLSRYEEAYQYNDTLAEHPDKIGRLNELTVNVRSVDVRTDADGFTADVSGQFHTDIISGGTTTPETPTQTPLPMGHGPFDASYRITDDRLRRQGVVRECW